jgi:hypothetical protein
VHSMPVPDQGLAQSSGRTRLGRWKMVMVMVVCAAPVVASYFTYYVIRPETRSSFGTLVEPQRPLPDVQVQRLDGQALNLQALKGQWLLLSTADAACDVACAQRLYLQRQLRETLGKEKDRLDWVWLISDSAPVSPEMLPGLQQAVVLRVPATTLNTWLPADTENAVQDHLYVVDPMGNLMMRLPANLTPEMALKAKRDLDRLLRASASWDEAGRPHPLPEGQ